ncbi:TPA: hypothetical protein EYP38_01115 [Candidatus Micrarchaeota archaeon]|nr:hypothetical protein [Candidatus Micrarchaeota archaeon]
MAGLLSKQLGEVPVKVIRYHLLRHAGRYAREAERGVFALSVADPRGFMEIAARALGSDGTARSLLAQVASALLPSAEEQELLLRIAEAPRSELARLQAQAMKLWERVLERCRCLEPGGVRSGGADGRR